MTGVVGVRSVGGMDDHLEVSTEGVHKVRVGEVQFVVVAVELEGRVDEPCLSISSLLSRSVL